MLEEIDIKRRDGIAHVALNRPALRNAVTLATVSYTHLTLPTILRV